MNQPIRYKNVIKFVDAMLLTDDVDEWEQIALWCGGSVVLKNPKGTFGYIGLTAETAEERTATDYVLMVPSLTEPLKAYVNQFVVKDHLGRFSVYHKKEFEEEYAVAGIRVSWERSVYPYEKKTLVEKVFVGDDIEEDLS